MPEFPLPDPPVAFHRLNPSPDSEKLWKERFLEVSKDTPPTLILPCHARDLKLQSTRDQLLALHAYPWPGKILLVLNAMEEGDRPFLKDWYHGLPAALQAQLTVLLADQAPTPVERGRRGKGFNLWLALHYLEHIGCRFPVIWQDIDCAAYEPGMTARLCLPILDPDLGFKAARAFYARVESRLYGRLTRQLYRPLLDAIRETLPSDAKASQRQWLEIMRGFKYPLAGETALAFDVATRLYYDGAWGLETRLNAQLSDLPPEGVCQVDWADRYVHRHHPLGNHRAEGLRAMAVEIVHALLEEATQRLPLGDWRLIQESYRRQARKHHEFDQKLSCFNLIERLNEPDDLFEEALDSPSVFQSRGMLLSFSAETQELLKEHWHQIEWKERVGCVLG